MLNKLFGGFFKEANKTEMEKLQAEEAKLNGKITELQNKKVRVSNALQFANVDLELEDTQANKKRVNKYEAAISEIDNEVQELGEQAGKLQSKMSQINADERQMHIDSLAEQDGKDYEEYQRGARAKKMLEEAFKAADAKTGYIGSGNPRSLIQDIQAALVAQGIAPEHHKNISNFQPYHLEEAPDHVAAYENAKKTADAKIDADLKELQEAIEKYLGKKIS